MPTVQPATEIWTGSSQASASDGAFTRIDYKPTRIFQLTCSADATDLDIYAAPNIPVYGEPYPDAPYCYAKTAAVKRLSPIFAEVTINYEGKAPSDNPSGDPTSAPAYVESWSDVETEEEIDTDWDGNPIVTAAGEPVHGIKAVFCDQVATIKRNIPLGSYSPYVAGSYRRKVNSDTFLGWPAGTAKVMKLGAQMVNQQYYTMTGVVQFRIPYLTTAGKAWYARWRHEGFYHKVDVPIVIGGSTVNFVKIMRAVDDQGKPTTKKVLLDVNGYRIPDWISYANLAAFPTTGSASKIYLAEDSGLTYRWNGTTYTTVTTADVSPTWRETKRYGSTAFTYLFGSTIIY